MTTDQSERTKIMLLLKEEQATHNGDVKFKVIMEKLLIKTIEFNWNSDKEE